MVPNIAELHEVPRHELLHINHGASVWDFLSQLALWSIEHPGCFVDIGI